ncbi:hypothetical protein [Terrarubrum flagellatum]|uniref:hypothetical protein n=1 Tax=Terrirubrum flagellatum TaxID=2895980 RepID=UPI0031452912
MRHIVRLVAFLLLAVVPAGRTAAHDWYTNKKNPVTRIPCCDDLDCHVIDNGDWWRKGDLYYVRWTNGMVYSIPVEQALPSEDPDGKAAACVLEGWLRCFFVPALL